MIPLRDDNPTVLLPLVTSGLILINIAVFFYELSLEPKLLEALIQQRGVVPAAALSAPPPFVAEYASLFTSMFLHGGWLHLAGNMLYLWIFGNNIEDCMGPLRFIVFYLIAGIAAASAHIYFNPASTIPAIGASGAVSGVLGGYLVLFPHARIRTLFILGWFIRIIRLPAWVLLISWIGLQILSQIAEPIQITEGGVAYAAHIGGFIAGFALIQIFRKYRRRTHFRYTN